MFYYTMLSVFRNFCSFLVLRYITYKSIVFENDKLNNVNSFTLLSLVWNIFGNINPNKKYGVYVEIRNHSDGWCYWRVLPSFVFNDIENRTYIEKYFNKCFDSINKNINELEDSSHISVEIKLVETKWYLDFPFMRELMDNCYIEYFVYNKNK